MTFYSFITVQLTRLIQAVIAVLILTPHWYLAADDSHSELDPDGSAHDHGIFHPEISAVFDFVGSYSREAHGYNFIGRDVGVMLQSEIDHYARAVIVLNAEEELNPWGKADPFGEFSPEIEEAYLETCSLLPDGFKLKAGIFFADFTRLGKIHNHELPFIDRPDSLGAILGDEAQSHGLEINWTPSASPHIHITGGIVDNIGAEEAITSTLMLLDGESTNLFRDDGDRLIDHRMYYTRVATSFELGSQANMSLGTNFARGGNPGDRRLMSADFQLRFLCDSSNQNSLSFGGEVLRGRSSGDFASDARFPTYPFSGSASAEGAYLYARYDHGEHWEATLRHDWLSSDVWSQTGVGVSATGISQDRQTQNTSSGYLGYRFNESSRLRFGISHIAGFPDAYANASSDWLGFVQWSIVIGHHHHAFQP